MTTGCPRGIERTATGFVAFVAVRGVRVRKRFRVETPLSEMLAWRERTRAELLLELHERQRRQGPPGSFRADATRYLEAVKALPTYAERVRDIGLWTALFGDRSRVSITATEIRAQRDAWLTVGPRLVQRWDFDVGRRRKVQTFVPIIGPLSASTVNHRLRALENLWTVLDGRRAPNPVREVPEANEPTAPPRVVPLWLVRAILAAMPPSKAKARLAVLAWTGIPPAVLQRLDRAAFDREGRAVLVPGRRKGHGAIGRWLPLTEAGWRAFIQLDREEAWGHHSWDNVRRAFRAACRSVGRAHGLDLHHLRPYDLRHALAARTYQATGDFRATQELLLHASSATTARYAAAAIDPRLTAAVAAVERAERKVRGRKVGRSPRRSPRKAG